MTDKDNDNKPIQEIEIHVDSDVFSADFYLPHLPPEKILMKRTKKTPTQSIEYKDSVLNVVDEAMVGEALIDIYRDIKDPKHGFILDRWVFLSPNEIKKYEDAYKTKGWIDVAIKYIGMGWISVIGYIKETNTFFIRRDGGSSYWDRAGNYEAYIDEKFDPKKFRKENDKLTLTLESPHAPLARIFEVQYTYSGLMKNIYPEWIID